MSLAAADNRNRTAQWTGEAVLSLAILVIAAALGFEYIGGYKPCALCLTQRYAYYAAIPVAALGLLCLNRSWRTMAGLLFGLCALAFVANTGLAAYHAGVEWGWWQGPQGCTGDINLTKSAGNLLSAIKTEKVIRCDEPQWRFILTFAGWNVLISAFLAGLAAWTAIRSLRA